MSQRQKLPKNSVHRALNALGDRWGLLIVQEAFLGISQFRDFHAKSGMSRSTLASRLRGLVRHGILEQRVRGTGKSRKDYHLTSRGRDLFGSVVLAWGWGVKWGVTNRNMPTTLVHTGCGKPMIPVMICRHCSGHVTLTSCTYGDGPGAGFERVSVQRLHRRRYSSSRGQSADVVDITGDRWTALIIATQYFGLHRFDDIQSYLGIATNILTDRLRALESDGILERRLYEIVPPRYEYWLTKKGVDTYPHSLSLMFWGDRWLIDGKEGVPVLVKHKPCGKRLGAESVCGECREPLTPDNVRAGRFKTIEPSRS